MKKLLLAGACALAFASNAEARNWNQAGFQGLVDNLFASQTPVQITSANLTVGGVAYVCINVDVENHKPLTYNANVYYVEIWDGATVLFSSKNPDVPTYSSLDLSNDINPFFHWEKCVLPTAGTHTYKLMMYGKSGQSMLIPAVHMKVEEMN